MGVVRFEIRRSRNQPDKSVGKQTSWEDGSSENRRRMSRLFQLIFSVTFQRATEPLLRKGVRRGQRTPQMQRTSYGPSSLSRASSVHNIPLERRHFVGETRSLGIGRDARRGAREVSPVPTLTFLTGLGPRPRRRSRPWSACRSRRRRRRNRAGRQGYLHIVHKHAGKGTKPS